MGRIRCLSEEQRNEHGLRRRAALLSTAPKIIHRSAATCAYGLRVFSTKAGSVRARTAYLMVWSGVAGVCRSVRCAVGWGSGGGGGGGRFACGGWGGGCGGEAVVVDWMGWMGWMGGMCVSGGSWGRWLGA